MRRTRARPCHHRINRGEREQPAAIVKKVEVTGDQPKEGRCQHEQAQEQLVNILPNLHVEINVLP